MPRLPPPARTILVIKLGGLGDVFQATAVLAPLRAAYPDAPIDFLVEAAAAAAIERDPRVRRVLRLDKQTMSSLDTIRLVRRGHYDLVIDLYGNPRSAILTFLSGAKRTVGLAYGWRGRLYGITAETRRAELPGAEVNLQALRAMGLPAEAPGRLPFPLPAEAVAKAAAFWQANGLTGQFVLGLLATGSWPAKRAAPAMLAAMAQAINEPRGGRVVLIGGPGDQADLREVHALYPAATLLAPLGALPDALALAARCTLLLANDSGPMHLASGFGVPILTLYGPTAPEGAYGPEHGAIWLEGLPCLVCNRLHCPVPGHPCMTQIPAAGAAAKATELLARAER